LFILKKYTFLTIISTTENKLDLKNLQVDYTRLTTMGIVVSEFVNLVTRLFDKKRTIESMISVAISLMPDGKNSLTASPRANKIPYTCGN
jgi:hypothetical protein